MSVLPLTVYGNADLRLRIWFSDGIQGFQKMSPDQRLAPNGYLPDGSIDASKLAPDSASPAIAVSSSDQDLAPNQRYVATGGTATTFNLPTVEKPGDVIRLDSAGSGGLTINDSGDSVWKQAHFGANVTVVDVFCPGNGAICWALAPTSEFGAPSLYRATGIGSPFFVGGPPGQTVTSFASSDDSTKLLVVSYNSKALYRSLNGGNTNSWLLPPMAIVCMQPRIPGSFMSPRIREPLGLRSAPHERGGRLPARRMA